MTFTKPMSLTKPISVPRVSTMASADLRRALSTLTLAFTDDPVFRWQYPDAEQYLQEFAGFACAFGGCAFTHKAAYHVGDHAGVALWLPPGGKLDHDAIAASLPAGREAEIAAVFEQLATFHPKEAHWYLIFLAVDPARQRRGHGSLLLADMLDRCDREHVAAYVESTNPRNIPLYQRHGFKLLGTVQVGTVPPLFPMLREAQ